MLNCMSLSGFILLSPQMHSYFHEIVIYRKKSLEIHQTVWITNKIVPANAWPPTDQDNSS